MIFDNIGNFPFYTNIPFYKEVTRFLEGNGKNPDFLTKAPHFIVPGKLYVILLKYKTQPATSRHFETHKYNADIQLILKGSERIQYAERQNLKIFRKYNIDNDATLYNPVKVAGNFIVKQNEFVFFYPGEAHRPSCNPGTVASNIVKMVFKLRIGGSYQREKKY